MGILFMEIGTRLYYRNLYDSQILNIQIFFFSLSKFCNQKYIGLFILHVKPKTDCDMTYFEKAKDVYDMSTQGKLLDAFEKYYHPDVVMEEPNGEVRKSKDVNREYQIKF